MRIFFEIWSLLEPKAEYANLFGHCKRLWESWPADKQEEVFLKIEKKKIEKKFVDYNPLLALRNNAIEPMLATALPKRPTDGTWRTRRGRK